MKVQIILLSILRPMDAILKKLLLPRGVGGEHISRERSGEENEKELREEHKLTQ